jgi:phage terminase Nu1 subunit (DNA packaging protein)
MSKVDLISKSAFAKLMGVSPAAVTKAVTEGRITVVRDTKPPHKDMIDPAVAQIQWSNNTRARSPSINAAPVSDGVAASSGTKKTAGNDESGYWKNRASREEAEAAMAQLKLAEMQGSLIRLDAVRAVLGTTFAAARESIMQIPSRVAPMLAAESDAAQVQIQLSAALHAALEGLANASGNLSTVPETVPA